MPLAEDLSGEPEGLRIGAVAHVRCVQALLEAGGGSFVDADLSFAKTSSPVLVEPFRLVRLPTDRAWRAVVRLSTAGDWRPRHRQHCRTAEDAPRGVMTGVPGWAALLAVLDYAA